jgi:uncharacterized membrane protein YeaQ/YmgE (transglycosylase-associated protein family)
MEITINVDLVDLVIFLIIGFVAGTAAARLMVRGGGSTISNTLLGIVGAFIGQFIFDSLNIELTGELLKRSISLADIVVAFLGALVLLIIAGILRR